jgi:hypothetical protein
MTSAHVFSTYYEMGTFKKLKLFGGTGSLTLTLALARQAKSLIFEVSGNKRLRLRMLSQRRREQREDRGADKRASSKPITGQRRKPIRTKEDSAAYVTRGRKGRGLTSLLRMRRAGGQGRSG